MNIKRICITLCAACAVSFSAWAQTARQVLDQTANKLRHCGGIEASFEGTQFKGLREAGSANGSIQVQGSKFKINSSNMTTWYNGRTQWTMLSGSDEVNVSNPSAAELQQVNPYAFLNIYKQGYNLKLNNTTYNNKVCHEVRLVSQSRNSEIQQMILVIDKQTHMPLSIRVKDNHGDWVRIRVNNLKTGKKWNDANFQFNSKQHPGIQVIDLR